MRIGPGTHDPHLAAMTRPGGSAVAGRIAPAASPSNPFHLARAYGARPAPESAAHAEGARRLLAGAVPGGVSFDAAGVPAPARSTLAFYAHPADRNAAATGVSLGRVLDVNG